MKGKNMEKGNLFGVMIRIMRETLLTDYLKAMEYTTSKSSRRLTMGAF